MCLKFVLFYVFFSEDCEEDGLYEYFKECFDWCYNFVNVEGMVVVVVEGCGSNDVEVFVVEEVERVWEIFNIFCCLE